MSEQHTETALKYLQKENSKNILGVPLEGKTIFQEEMGSFHRGEQIYCGGKGSEKDPQITAIKTAESRFTPLSRPQRSGGGLGRKNGLKKGGVRAR